MSSITSPAKPAIHIDPYTAAGELRGLLREVYEQTRNGNSQLSAPQVDVAISRVVQAREKLMQIREQNDALRLVLTDLHQAAARRKPAEMRALIKSTQAMVNRIETHTSAAVGFLGEKTDTYTRNNALGWLNWIRDRVVGGPSGANLTEMVRRCRVLVQALPTTPHNPTVPAESVVTALVAILSNFGYVTPRDQDAVAKAKLELGAMLLEQAVEAVEFEDIHGMSKEQYVEQYGSLPADEEYNESDEEGDE